VNEYHDADRAVEGTMDLLDLWVLREEARGLRIPTLEEVEELTMGEWTFDQRGEFTRGVSWSLPTRNWVEAMLRILLGKKVIEIGAGTGFVGTIFKLLDVDWTSTDINPPSPTGRPWMKLNPVHQMTWEQALELPHDVIFISWWPYREPEGIDLKIARWALKNEKRVIIVGEGYGGCTGSEDFWRYALVKQFLDYEQDLAQWSGIHDYTYEVVGFSDEPKRLWSDPIDTEAEDE